MLAAAALLSISTSMALEPYNPPEFNPDEWTFIGTGVYSPGVFDWIGTEYPYDLPAKVWENKATEQVYWVEPDGSEKKPFEPDRYEGDTWFDTPAAFIVYANNNDKVYTSPIWAMQPLIFCVYQQVPEIMGMLGSENYYGKKEDRVISFPANSYKMLTIPTGQPTTNKEGIFGVLLPDPAGIEDVEVSEAGASVYYNMQGMQVANPERGNIYIVKNAKSTKKVIF